MCGGIPQYLVLTGENNEQESRLEEIREKRSSQDAKRKKSRQKNEKGREDAPVMTAARMLAGKADAALYQAKAAGRNTVRWPSSQAADFLQFSLTR